MFFKTRKSHSIATVNLADDTMLGVKVEYPLSRIKTTTSLINAINLITPSELIEPQKLRDKDRTSKLCNVYEFLFDKNND